MLHTQQHHGDWLSYPTLGFRTDRQVAQPCQDIVNTGKFGNPAFTNSLPCCVAGVFLGTVTLVATAVLGNVAKDLVLQAMTWAAVLHHRKVRTQFHVP